MRMTTSNRKGARASQNSSSSGSRRRRNRSRRARFDTRPRALNAARVSGDRLKILLTS